MYCAKSDPPLAVCYFICENIGIIGLPLNLVASIRLSNCVSSHVSLYSLRTVRIPQVHTLCHYPSLYKLKTGGQKITSLLVQNDLMTYICTCKQRLHKQRRSHTTCSMLHDAPCLFPCLLVHIVCRPNSRVYAWCIGLMQRHPVIIMVSTDVGVFYISEHF